MTRLRTLCSAKLSRIAAIAGTVTVATYGAEATVLRKTQVADTSGGVIDTWTAVGTYPCSFARSQITPLERERDVRIQSISFWTFKFPSGSDIRTADRLRVGTRTFEVSGAGEDSEQITLVITAQEIL